MKDDFWVEESDGNLPLMKRKRKVLKREIGFAGWGSRPLMDFLESIGQDTVKKHSQREVTEFVNKYVKDKGLLVPGKKNKKVHCDEMLYALFGKQIVYRTKLFDLLEEHFAENQDDLDYDLLCSSEEDILKDKVSKSGTGYKKDLETPKSLFAAIISDNIRLVYLKRTLVQDLLKNYENFAHKVVGSFVRIKSDPDDIYQKNQFQLQQVTGVEYLSGDGDAGTEAQLRVSNYLKDVSIHMLSDANFSEEEIDDLNNRIGAGQLKKLTVKELESKVHALHIDITKHWIAKEISLLQKLIDHANEKGRRRELFEFIERRKMLQNPSEVEKLLLTVPVVTAEELVLDKIHIAEKEGSNLSPDLDLKRCSDVSVSVDPAITFRDVFKCSNATRVEHGTAVKGAIPVDASHGVVKLVNLPQFVFNASDNFRRKNDDVLTGVLPFQVLNGHRNIFEACKVEERNTQTPPSFHLELSTPNKVSNCITELLAVSKSTKDEPRHNVERPVAPIEVIDLSDDEPPLDAEDENGACRESIEDDIWHYLDPQGNVQGPFSTCMLKRWYDYNYFHPGFAIWKTGQSPNESVLLVDVLERIFPAIH